MRSLGVPQFIRRLADAWVSRRASAIAQSPHGTPQPAAVIIGGSRGIGLEIAHLFAIDGQRVVICARSQSALSDAARQIEGSTGLSVKTIALDATMPGAPAELETRLAGLGIYADVLVMSAGIGLSGPFEEQSPHEIDQLIALNVTALTRHIRHVLPGMRARARGGVMTIASLGGYVPGPNQAAYYASRAYVLSLTEALAREIAGSGVRMTVVAPGPVETGFHQAMKADTALYRRILPAKRPEDVARAAYTGFVLGRKVVVPGLMMALSAIGLRILPHTLTVPLVGWLLRRRCSGRSHS